MRLFLAIEIPDALRDALNALQSKLKQELPDCSYRWTSPTTFHISLAFLGEVHTARVEQLERAAQTVCAAYGPLDLVAAGFSSFPAPTHPRILIARVLRQSIRDLKEMGQAMQRATNPFGDQALDRSFNPHITLARSSHRLRGALLTRALEAIRRDEATEFGRFRAREVTLFESHLGQGPPRHVELARFPLGT